MDESAEPQTLQRAGDENIACAVCQHEIPLSAAVWREGSDYVAYFCGLDCYDQWRKRRPL